MPDHLLRGYRDVVCKTQMLKCAHDNEHYFYFTTQSTKQAVDSSPKVVCRSRNRSLHCYTEVKWKLCIDGKTTTFKNNTLTFSMKMGQFHSCIAIRKGNKVNKNILRSTLHTINQAGKKYLGLGMANCKGTSST